MDWGMANRMAQLIQSDGHALFLPVDHGYFQGPTRKLEKPRQTIEPLLPYADALFITRGVLRSSVDPDNTKPVILRVSGGTSMAGKDLANEGITTSMEEAIRLNASAVGISIFIGTDYEKESLLNLSKLVNEGERYGIPVMAVTAVGKELEKRDARYLALCCRIAAELGARVVKTYWCQGFEKVSGGCPVPVIMAGGPQVNTELEVFEFVYDGMQKGAIGVNLGRNIWQNDFPVAMIKAIGAIVHQKATAKEAQELYQDLKGKVIVVQKFEDDEDGYLGWVDTNPGGFVVNTYRKPLPHYLVLHRATCSTIKGTPTAGKYWTKGEIKICSPVREELEKWAQQQVGGNVSPCKICKP